MTLPWLIMGDYNSVLNTADKIRDTQVTMIEIEDFHQCIESCGLMEMPVTKSKYTWRVGHGESRIMSKID